MHSCGMRPNVRLWAAVDGRCLGRGTMSQLMGSAEPMPWSVERPSGSCNRMAFEKTVDRPSYTAGACSRHRESSCRSWRVLQLLDGAPPAAIGLRGLFLFLTERPRACLPLHRLGESNAGNFTYGPCCSVLASGRSTAATDKMPPRGERRF